MKEIGYSLIDTIEKHAKTMGSPYLETINAQRQKLYHSDQTPSAQIISKSTTSCYQPWLLQQSKTHHQRLLKYRIPNVTQLNLQQQAIHSQASQKDLEKHDCCDIETYIESYYRLNKL